MNIAIRPFEIKMTNINEIRMGAPYNICDIEILGFDKAKLPLHGWQDKHAWRKDSKYLVLIKWNFESNKPGFHLFLIDVTTGQTKESPRLFGLPNSIAFTGDKIKVNKYLYDKEKSTSDNLCCTIDEVYEF